MTRHEYRQYGALMTARRGTDLPHARLDEDKVRAIRANRHGWTAWQWAQNLGVHVRTIDKVRDRRSWAHVV